MASSSSCWGLLSLLVLVTILVSPTQGFFSIPANRGLITGRTLLSPNGQRPVMPCLSRSSRLWSSSVAEPEAAEGEVTERVIQISEAAMAHLMDLKTKENKDHLFLRMGVRSGGCSGMSYVMDLVKPEDVTEEDHMELYPEQGFTCVVDPKSMLYLFGLVLDYKDALIGGGFQFFNPSAQETCGCGKSFGV